MEVILHLKPTVKVLSEGKPVLDENKPVLPLQKEEATLAPQCMLQILPKIEFIRLSELLRPLNQQHASQIQLIISK
jgi:hypothetical protein